MKNDPDKSPKPKRALTLVFDGIEEVEALAPVDILRRAGVDTTMASLMESTRVTGRNGISFIADTRFPDIDPDSFDLVFLPGGPGVLELVNDERVSQLLRFFDQSRKPIAAICAAPKVLAAVGVLDGREATGHASVRPDLPQASDAPIVISDHILTSQGAGTAIDFGLELARLLTGDESARSVAESIHAPKLIPFHG